ncbi:MAG: ABC transporter permease [Lachnospiraceae bacterium]|jgi:peptide/nickel transport system permease protein
MIRYFLKRILMLIPVVLAVAIAIFTIMYFVPGDPAEIIMGSQITDEQRQECYEKIGIDKPYIVQLGVYLYKTFIRFDMGNSWMNSKSVADELAARLPKTMMFAIASMVVQILIGVPLGVYAATHHNKFGDYLSMIIALAGVSIPSFWLALMLMLLFGVKLHWLPIYGVKEWTGWILPIFCGTLGVLAQMTRQARSSMLEVIRSDYIDTARAKGMPRRTIIYKYALPNGLIPLVQTLGNAFGTSLGGTLIIETVFSIPGVGMYLQQGIATRDRPIVQGSVVVLSILFSLIMLLVDMAFAFIDPRIKAQYAGRGKRRKRARVNKRLRKEAA